MSDFNHNRNRPRLLMLSYACSPVHGSEPGVGWNRAVGAARYCDTWVIVEGCAYETEVRKYLAEQGEVENLSLQFLHKTRLERIIEKVPGLYYLAYNFWQRRAYRLAKKLDRQWDFDLVHHVNFNGFREPGYTWKLGKPFIWGPVGGTQNYPWRFLKLADWKGRIKEASRSIANSIQLYTGRRVRKAARVANPVLVANSSVADAMRAAAGIRSQVLPDCGVQQLRATPREVNRSRRSLRILWSGNLIPLKALPVLLHALARLKGEVDFELRILGSGYCQKSWEDLTRRLGLAERVTFLGRLPHAEALAQRSWADLFVFTSLRDSSGNVVVEAFADGIPVVSFDHQGVRDIVDETCGIKVPVTTPEEGFQGFAGAIRRLAGDPDLMQRLSDGALERARIYDWSMQGRRMAAVYRSVLGEGFHWDDEVPANPVYGHQQLPETVEAVLVGGSV